MADRNKDLLGRLADLSEEAVQRLAEAPGADRALQALKALGDKVDELQRRTRGFEELESRLRALEKKVDSLSKAPPRASTSRTSPHAPKSSQPPKQTCSFTRDRGGREEQSAGDIRRSVKAGELEQHGDGREPDEEGDAEARPRGSERGGDDRAAQGVTARPRRGERDEMHAVSVERRPCQC